MPHGDAVIAVDDGIAMVLNSLATAPAASISRATSCPMSLRCTWPGTNWVKLLTTAMMGLRKSSSFMPVARHRARAPAILRPAVEVWERRGIAFVMMVAYFLLGIETIKPTAGGRLYGRVGLDIATEGSCRRIWGDFKHADDFFHPGNAACDIYRSLRFFFTDNAE